MTATAMSWTSEMRADATVIALRGDINEQADFDGLVGELSGRVIFDLGDLGRINSQGVRLWINFIRAVRPSIAELVYERCPVTFVAQLNMIRDFSGGGHVRSLFAPYVNESNDEVTMRLLEVDGLDLDNPPSFQTPDGHLVFDEIPESYFSYLRDAAR